MRGSNIRNMGYRIYESGSACGTLQAVGVGISIINQYGTCRRLGQIKPTGTGDNARTRLIKHEHTSVCHHEHKTYFQKIGLKAMDRAVPGRR